MYTFGYFELYATFIGWFLYGEAARFFIESGLIATIPLLLFVKTYSDATTGQHTKSGAGSAVNQMSLESLKTAMFIIFFFLPWITINPSQINFELNDGQVVNLNNNESTFQGRFVENDYQNVRIPLAWYLLTSVSGGLNTAFINMLPEPKQLRKEIMSLENVHIKDAQLSKEVNRFHDECYSKALHYYRKQESQNTPVEIDSDDGGDPFWPGSQTMIQIYGKFNVCTENCAPIFRADKPVYGFNKDPRVDVEPEYEQGGEVIGRPLCSVWWNNKLKDDIYNEAVLNDVETSGFNSLLEMVGGFSDAELKNVIIKETMTNKQSVKLNNPNMKYADSGRFSSGNIQAFISSIGVNVEGFKSGSTTYQIIRSLPIVQGLLLLVFYFSLPILMIISRLSLKGLVTVIGGFFLIRFLTVLWAFAYWIDEIFLASSVHMSNGVFVGIDGDYVDRQSLEYILILGYIIIPAAFVIILGWVGYRALATGTQSISGESTNSGNASNAGAKTGAKIGVGVMKK